MNFHWCISKEEEEDESDYEEERIYESRDKYCEWY
jgi:hypothetical protein